MNVWIVLAPILAVLCAPFIGGLLRGIDRKLTAHMQGRIGPPVTQNFYDFLKLMGKQRLITTKPQLIWVYGYLISVIAALVLLYLGQDLLMIVFVLGFGGVCLALGSFSTKSPYSIFGGHRELLQILAYEPILLLAVVAIYLRTDTFMVKGILDFPNPLMGTMWLAFIGVFCALLIKMRKSPFDISASEHAHQELVRGVYTEYSGPYLAIIELTHWYELALLLSILALFWAHPLWVGALIALFCWFVAIIVDNIAARLTWSWMLRLSLIGGLGFVLLNVAALYLPFWWGPR
jgi:formate hydrogenlyase subunit 4